jgi:hypothetical protein
MKKILYALIVAGLMFTSCAEYEKEISWELDDYPDMLVVEGTITNEFKQQVVLLTKTADYFDTLAPSSVSEAAVIVREGNNTYSFTESLTHKGLYLSDIEFSGEPLKTYELEIILSNPLNGQTDFTAVSTMPEGINLDTILCEIYEMPDLGFEPEEGEEIDSTLLGIAFFGKEPDSPDNYYLARIFRNGKCWQSNAKELLLYNDDYNNGNYHDSFIYNKNVAANDTIKFEIRSVERGYYDFIIGLQQIDQSGDAYSMSGPPANAVGNIVNGKALGYFTASYISDASGIALDMRAGD